MMRLRPRARVVLLLKGREVPATYKSSARGLHYFLLENGRTVPLKRPKVLQRLNPSSWKSLDAPRVPIKLESATKASCRRQRWASTKPGKESQTKVKGGNARETAGWCRCTECLGGVEHPRR